MLNEMKKCSFCGEEILAEAKKCRYCGEWLDLLSTEETSVKALIRCPFCAEQIGTDAVACPHCGEKPSDYEGYVLDETRRLRYSGAVYGKRMAVLFPLFLVVFCVNRILAGADAERQFVVSGIVGMALLLLFLYYAEGRLRDAGRSSWWLLLAFLGPLGFVILLIMGLVLKSKPQLMKK